MEKKVAGDYARRYAKMVAGKFNKIMQKNKQGKGIMYVSKTKR